METVKILIVDDDEVDRMAVRRALKAAGVQTEMVEVSDCKGALAALQQPFDCVFLDYRLPDGNGLSLVQQIRASNITVPLVVLTGQGDEQVAVQVMKAGAYDYLSKAKVTPDSLYQTLRHAIRVREAEIQTAIANQKLKESEERYRLVLEGANDGIWDWYCATDEVYCNERLLEIIGVSRSEFSLTPAAFTELMHPDDLPRIHAAISAHLTRSEKCEVEFRIRHASGEYRYCIARGKAQRDSFGCPLRISGVLTDITESKRLEQALRASESRFRRLAESSVIGLMVASFSGNILDANDAFLEIVGYSRQDLIAGRLNWREIVARESASVHERMTEELIRLGFCRHIEQEYIHKDGSRIPVLLGGALVEGIAETGIFFVLDLSERKRSEAEIVKLNRDLERRINELETLLDVIPIGIAIAQDPECQHIRINPSLTKLLGLSPDSDASMKTAEVEQSSYKFYRHGKELTDAELPMRSAATGVEVLDVELDVVTHEGRQVAKLLGNAAPLFDEQGKSRGSVGAFWDITERKRSEGRERFLAEASAILAASLEYKTTLENLARLTVPRLTDWCTIYTVEADQSLTLVAVAHSNPAKERWAIELQRRYPVNPSRAFGVTQVIRNGQSALYPQISDSNLAEAADDAEHHELLRQLDAKSLICVPMKARGRTLGAISLISAESGRTYNQTDLALAEELGRRAGLAVDNARLYQEATDIGENLRQAIIILGEQQQQLRALQRISNLLNQRLTNLPNLLQVMVGAVCDAIGEAQFCLIELHNPQTNQLDLTATAGTGIEKLLSQDPLNSKTGFLAHVFLTGKSQLFKQEGSSSYLPNIPDMPASMYAVAIESAQAGRLGVLAIGNWENPRAFDVEDQNLLMAVGEQAAIAINNARLINTLEEREERLAVQNETLARQNHDLELNRQQIEQQNLQLLEAARLKSQFLATMSHELRTPMNSIIGFAQVLLRQRLAPLGSAQVEMVERILNNGKNLLALINDILDFSKIEARRLSLKTEEFNLTQLISTTIAELQPLADQKSLDLIVDVSLDNSQVVNDSNRLRQVLVNLLSNAIKFTESGSVEVKVRELTPNRLLLIVKDTGIGIAAAELNHIFEEFRQVDQTTTRKYPGTGLGLAITKSLVHIMKGTITVESKLNQGSTFRVELPRRVEEVGESQKEYVR
ncbi:MAG: PAS domain S-box protein [Chroococcidiopsidaceae cyanobacterium CP_BM_ER_R8_30]|nr:PAS domain S-box protein [Chroococcidiopsidaceae cyanobacterium CP_BM_ER_R8_30]